MAAALVTLAVVLPTSVGWAGSGRPPPPVPKKLIEMGWDEPDPSFMRKHLAELEASPFDGCVYHVSCPGPDGKPGSFTRELWGNRRFRESELEPALADLRATPFRRFRWNFLRVNVTPGTLDWFDDHQAVLGNLELAASVARRGGSAGVMIDTEPYEGPVFDYARQRDAGRRSYAEYAAQARRRGAEVMRALERGYPGLAVFLTVSTTWPYIVWKGDRVPLERQRYALLVPFVDGMVAAASDSATIVDGMEASYPARDRARVDEYFRVARHDALAWVADPVRYRRVVSQGFAVWLDHDQQRRGWNVRDPDRNYRPPARLREVVRRALELSDEYVWVYSERPRWWTEQGGRRDLPEAYVRALREARSGLTP